MKSVDDTIHSLIVKIAVNACVGECTAGCPFPRGSGDLIHRKCSNLTGNLGQKVGKHVYSNRNQTFWIIESY